MIYRILTVFITVYLSISIAQANEKLNVLACEPEWAALVKELGADLVQVKSATTGTQDPHHIQARPSLIAAARRANLLVCTGADLEIGWLPLLQRKSANPAIQAGNPGIFMATEFVLLKGQTLTLDRSEGDIHAEGNPHISLNPHLILQVAKPLSDRLQQLDSKNREAYAKLYVQFRDRWQAAIVDWERKAKSLKNKKIVVHHDSWLYLSDWLGLKTLATLEPKSGLPPTISHLSRVLKLVQEQPAELIIYSSYQSARSANWLGERAKIPVVAMPNTVGSLPEVTDLFSLFEQIILKLKGQ